MAEEYENETPPPAAEYGEPPPAAQVPYGRPPRGARFRRWVRSGTARLVAVGLLAGLVGGLIGGGIVAAVDGGDHGPSQVVRVQRGLPPGLVPLRPRRAPLFPGRRRRVAPSPTTTS